MDLPVKKDSFFSKQQYKKFLFIHVPKTGGTYLHNAMKKHRNRCPSLRLKAARGHLMYKEYEIAFADAGVDISAMKPFVVTRNPWDYHVSMFHYIRQDVLGKKTGQPLETILFKNFSISDYFEWIRCDSSPGLSHGRLRLKFLDYLKDLQGNYINPIIFRQEFLTEDLENFASEHNLELNLPKEKLNTSVRSDYRTYYSDEDAEFVASYHAEDISKFGYSF